MLADHHDDHIDTLIPSNIVFGEYSWIFWPTFFTSLFSSTLGIMKFLRNGPCQLLPNSGFLDGFFQFGNILAMLSTLFCLLGKGHLLIFAPLLLWKNYESTETEILYESWIVWICLSMLPQLMFVCLIFYLKVFLFSWHSYLHLIY